MKVTWDKMGSLDQASTIVIEKSPSKTAKGGSTPASALRMPCDIGFHTRCRGYDMTSCIGDDGLWRQCTFGEELTRAVIWMLDQFVASEFFYGPDESHRVPPELLVEMIAVQLGTSSDNIGTDAHWPDETERTLLVALVLLVERHLPRDPDGVIGHYFESAGEHAIGVLVSAGLMIPEHLAVQREPGAPTVVGGRWSDTGEVFRKSIWNRAEYGGWIEELRARNNRRS